MSRDRVFLRRVADFCTSPAFDLPLSEMTFVVPNKRAAMFLKKYVRQAVTAVVMMPRFMTMRTFVDILSDRPQGADLQLLFTLYDAYCDAARRHDFVPRDFDSFIFWGDMMLSDFDDIDKSLANAGDIFKNLHDNKEILSDYLNDEQKDIIRSVWGENRLTECVTEFWAHISDNPDKDSVSDKFLTLWKILPDIYTGFHRMLEQKNISTSGRQYRKAADIAAEADERAVRGASHYAFVGFNDLSHSETIIFERLRKAGLAMFFWDTAPLAMCAGSVSMPESLRRLSKLAAHFRAPEGFEPDADNAPLPEITVTSVPSNSAQAKAAGMILEEWINEGYIDKADPMNTAIVIPDQGLLLPMLMALPEAVKSVNISMGLPFRTTSFAILLSSVIAMQLHARDNNGVWCYFYRDVLEILKHPHIQAIAAAEAEQVAKYIAEARLYNISATELMDVCPRFAALFAPLRDQGDVELAAAYLTGLLDWLGAELSAVAGEGMPSFELKTIDFFLGEIDKLTGLVHEHDVKIRNRTFLQLFERVFASRSLALSGKPLQGLQILGVLETRALDFDNVIVLSMNDGVFPRRQYAKTMIPGNLRWGFDLPDFDSLEWTYSYSFFRLVARAKHVAILYDSRTDGRGKGERSRYISQMQYIMPRLTIEERQLSVGSVAPENAPIEIDKSPLVMAELARFKKGGDLRVSTSALNEYLRCPLSFYLKYVRSFRGSDEMETYITNANYGTIVHNTIQALFRPLAGTLVGTAQYDRWLAGDNTEIEELVTAELLGLRKRPGENPKLDVEEQIAREAIASIVRADLKAERDKYAPGFTFIANEMKVNTIAEGKVWKIDDDLSLNFVMSVDRVDRISADTLRFIDFKTGNEDTSAESLGSLFKTGESKKHGMFQLLTYCEAYLSLVDPDVEIEPHIHPMRELSKGSPIADLRVSSEDITGYKAQLRDNFRPLLHHYLHRIFGPDGSFEQTQDQKVCDFCNFASLCGRIKSN